MSYPRRNQYRHTLRAARELLGAGVAVVAALCLLAWLWAAHARGFDELSIGAGLLIVLATLAARRLSSGCRQVRAAWRNKVGADSEDENAVRLRVLCDEGWMLSRSLDWPGRGDIDHALLSPDGRLAVAVETKTRYWYAYAGEQRVRVLEQAKWLAQRKGCHGAVATLAIARARRLERFEHGVLVVSSDLLVDALRAAELASRGGALARIAPTSESALDRRAAGRVALARQAAPSHADRRGLDDASIAAVARHAAEHQRMVETEDELERILGLLDRGVWFYERGARVEGVSVFLLLGASGVFVLRPSWGHWTIEQIDSLARTAGTVRSLMPDYQSPVRVVLVIIGDAQQPRQWFTASGASAWLLGAHWLLEFLAGFADHGLSSTDLARLRELAELQHVQTAVRPLLVRGCG